MRWINKPCCMHFWRFFIYFVYYYFRDGMEWKWEREAGSSSWYLWNGVEVEEEEKVGHFPSYCVKLKDSSLGPFFKKWTNRGPYISSNKARHFYYRLPPFVTFWTLWIPTQKRAKCRFRFWKSVKLHKLKVGFSGKEIGRERVQLQQRIKTFVIKFW